MGQLTGKVALVTGASRGIGAAVGQRLAADGASVALAARTINEGDHPHAGSLATVVEQIAAGGGSALAIAADLAEPEERRRVVDTVTQRLGPVDILINNAAITYFEPVDTFSEKHYRLMFEIQVRAPFELAQLVLPSMRERRSGWIVNVSSGVGRHPSGPPYRRGAVGGTVYGMCKAALERFTTGLAAEVYEDGIAVNVVSPSGLVLTPGVLYHRLDQFTPPEHYEDVAVVTEAIHALATGDPATLTGRVALAKPLLEELGRPIPAN